jgi:TonB family protein
MLKSLASGCEGRGMLTLANAQLREKSSLGIEWGLAFGLIALIIMFELIPSSELGRLSTRTSDSEMEAVEADLAFDDEVEEQEEEVQEESEALEEEALEVIQEIEVTLSLSEDTEGLSEVSTFQQTEELSQQGDEMGPPRFMPVEVFPVCTYQPMPAYPDMARQAGVEGNVTLWLYIRADGTVADVQLYNSSGVGSLDQAAISAARNTRWTPARNNSVPVGVWTSLTYRFVLTN